MIFPWGKATPTYMSHLHIVMVNKRRKSKDIILLIDGDVMLSYGDDIIVQFAESSNEKFVHIFSNSIFAKRNC